MKHLLLTIIAAVLVVGCATTQSPESQTAEALGVSIHHAASYGNIEAVKRYIASGADVNKTSGGGRDPLSWAVQDGHKEIAELLIANGADVNANDHAGTAPLHRAAFRGWEEIAELLIAKGADVNARNNFNYWTPLHWASDRGHKEIAELLITAGSDVNLMDKDGKTPLDVAIGPSFTGKSKIPETADLLRKHGGKTAKELPPATLLESVDVVDLQGIKDFLAKGVDVNAKDGTLAPLHLAAFRGYTEVVELLVAAGADVNAKIQERFFGGTPLTRAAYGGHKEIVELLISNGADVNAKNEDDETPLDFAIIRKRTETIDLLRKHGGKTGEELKAEGK
jgi:cytohesin